jgi:hypothetical protein
MQDDVIGGVLAAQSTSTTIIPYGHLKLLAPFFLNDVPGETFSAELALPKTGSQETDPQLETFV